MIRRVIWLAPLLGLLLLATNAHATTVFDGGGVTIDGHCSDTYNLLITQDDVTYRNYTFTNVTDSNIIIGRYNHVTLENLTIKNWNCNNVNVHNHAGIKCDYCKNLTVRNNTITGLTPNNFGDGVYVLSDDTPGNPSGGGHTIINNNISGGWDGIGGDEEYAVHGGFDQNTMITNNHVLGCWDDGIQVEGGDTNVIVAYNVISGCGAGIAFAAPIAGPLSVQYNLIQYIQTGYLNSHYCFKVGGATTAFTYLRNNECRADNTQYVPGGADGISTAASSGDTGMGPIQSRHNNFKASRYALDEYPDTPTGQDYDYDCLTTTAVGGNGNLLTWGPTQYSSVSMFSAATGEEAHGVTTCPLIPLYQPPPCADYTGDGVVDQHDIDNYTVPTNRLDVANYDLQWDRNLDGVINALDLVTNWIPGPCP